MLEPKDTDKSAPNKDWERMGSQISELGLWDDDEQPLPTNVMYPGERVATAAAPWWWCATRHV